MKYKRFIIPVLASIISLGTIVYASQPIFTSFQTGASPTNGYVLQTNGSNSTWVATSTLGIASTINGTTGQFPYFSGTNTLTATSAIFNSGGLIGIGTTTPSSPLHIDTGTNDTNIPLYVSGNVNDFQGGLIQNANNGSNASTGWIACNNQDPMNTGCLNHYVELGIDSSGFSVQPSDPFLLASTTGDMLFDTVANNTGFDFFTQGNPGTERFTIQANGNLGVGTSTPWGLLSVNPNGLTGNTPDFVVGSSTATRFIINQNGNVGIGSTTPASLLSIGNTGGINFTLATSTFSTTGGINLTSGCFAINGTCVSGGGGGAVSSVTNSDSSLTISPTTGAVVASLNLGHANTWTGQQTFNTAAPIFGSLGTGLLKGNGASAATIAANGTDYTLVSAQTCTNQAITALTAAGGSTCSSITDSFISGAIGVTHGGTGLTSLSANKLYYVNGAGNAFLAVATTSPTFGLGLTSGGTWGDLGTAPTLNIATSSLYTGAANALPYFTGTNTLGSINAGTNGYVLGMSGGVPAWVATSSIQNLTLPLSVANGGTADSSLIAGQLLYGSGTSAVQTVATSSLAVNSSLSVASGSLGAQIGGSAATLGLNLANANTWTGQQIFNGNATTTMFTDSGTLWLGGITGSTQCLHVDTNGKVSGTGSDCGSGGGLVSSVTNSDSTLTISPTTGAVVASLNLGNANTWTAEQTFNKGINVVSTGGSPWYAMDGNLLAYASSTNQDTIFGLNAGGKNATTSATANQNNSFFGFNAGNITTGTYNVFNGFNSGLKATLGSYNTAIGSNSYSGDTASGSATGSYNTAIGSYALSDIQYSSGGAQFNTAVGTYACENCSGSSQYNTAIGYNAEQGASGYGVRSNNTVIGSNAGYGLNANANNNIFLGFDAASTTTTGSNNIAIGYDIGFSSITASNKLDIGNLIYGTGINGEGTNISTGNVGIGTTTPATVLTVAGGLSFYGTIPTLSSCGTSPSITKGSTDNAGEITEGSVATGCTITFAASKTNAPFCTVTEQSGLAASYTISTSAITITNIGALSSTKIDYACIQNNN